MNTANSALGKITAGGQ